MSDLQPERILSIRILNRGNQPLPQPATAQSAGMDLRANLDAAVVIEPGERKLIPTGLHLELPAGTEAQVRPRSGLAMKHGITVLNAPGTIDADYRGDVGVLLINLGQVAFTIEPGERIAQLVVARYEKVEWVTESDALDSTSRGSGGFGHTGIQ